MLTDKDCRNIVDYLVLALKSDTELQDVMAKAMLRNEKSKVKRLISLSAAAKLLGRSESWLYKNKSDGDRQNFSYIKSGDSKSSTILFNANTLIEEYEALMLRRKSCLRVGFKNVV